MNFALFIVVISCVLLNIHKYASADVYIDVWGWSITLHRVGGMILCVQWVDGGQNSLELARYLTSYVNMCHMAVSGLFLRVITPLTLTDPNLPLRGHRPCTNCDITF